MFIVEISSYQWPVRDRKVAQPQAPRGRVKSLHLSAGPGTTSPVLASVTPCNSSTQLDYLEPVWTLDGQALHPIS